MPRIRRTESPTGIYHVMLRGNNKAHIFEMDYEKEKFLKLLSENVSDFGIEIYAYCIMSNHVHLLLRVEYKQLSEFMRKISWRYAMYYNIKNSHIGHVYQGRFKSECIDSEQYFWSCLRYIHMNPIKAKIASNVFEYKFSSALEYFIQKPYLLHLKAFKLYNKSFNNFQEFKKLHENQDLHIFEDIAEDTIILYEEGLEFFILQIKEEYNLQSALLVTNMPVYCNKLKKLLNEKLKIPKAQAEKLIKNYRKC